ncbi:uncharacterized protein METZ01_LOCUS221616, partial [marine metagenome]
MINSVITVTISGMVIFSFTGLSSQFNYNSELSVYKTTLDSIRIEQSKLKGQAQSFYLNVTEVTVKEGLRQLGNSITFIRESLANLKSDKNQIINNSILKSNQRNNLQDLNLIENEIENLELFTKKIALNSSEQMTSAPEAKKNISSLINAFNEFKDKRKRIIFKIRSKRGLIAGKPEYEKFMQKMMGGETKDGRVGTEGYEKPEFLSVNLFNQLNKLIAELDGIISASSQENQGDRNSLGFTDFEKIFNDYGFIFQELSVIVNETETKNNIDSFAKLNQLFRETYESVKKSGLLVIESKMFADSFSELNLTLSIILDDINSAIKKEMDKINASVIDQAGGFTWVVMIITIVGLAVSLLFGFFVRRSITIPVNDLVDM